MYKLCVFAGTTEGRALVELLAGQPVAVTACVATEYGGALLEPRENLTVSLERLTREEMEELFTREGFALVVDATHPYAAAVTENIAAACERTGTEYLRLLRSSAGDAEGAVRVLVTAELKTIKERFAARMRGNLPPPVAAMLERNHGSFDKEPHRFHVVSGETELEGICGEIAAQG